METKLDLAVSITDKEPEENFNRRYDAVQRIIEDFVDRKFKNNQPKHTEMVILDFPIHQDNRKWLFAEYDSWIIELLQKHLPGLMKGKNPLAFINRLTPADPSQRALLLGVADIQRFRIISYVYPVVVTIEIHLAADARQVILEKVLTVHNSEWLNICDLPLLVSDKQLSFKTSSLITTIDIVLSAYKYWPCTEPDFAELKEYYNVRGFRIQI